MQNLVAIELAYINTKHPDFHEANLFQRSQELEISKHFNEFHVNNESTKDNKVTKNWLFHAEFYILY